jgi:hypothetical protein
MGFIREEYFWLYSELPVFEGILCAYLDGFGTSDILTNSYTFYFYRAGNSDSYPIIYSKFARSISLQD